MSTIEQTGAAAVLRATAVLFLVSALFSAAAAQNDGLQNKKAQEVLNKAKAAVGKKTDPASIKALTVIYETTTRVAFQNKNFESNASIEVNANGFDKIRATKSIEHFLDNKPTNNEKQQLALNGDEFFFDTKVFSVNGEKINFDSNAEIDRKQVKSSFRYEMFHLFLPFLLDASWYIPMNYQYLGTAESKDGKAEVLELAAPNKTTYRLFFDEKTHLLLMMMENWTGVENKSFENKYYFSDYQLKNGLLVATKIVVEKNGRVVEEKTVRDVKINPQFKPNFFVIK